VNRAIGVLSIASPLAGSALVSFALVFAAEGCAQHPTEPDALPDRYATTQQVEDRPLTVPAQPTLIKQGLPPLVYMSESAATLKFTDMDADTDLASTEVTPRQFISIDAQTGIRVGSSVVVAGPLRPEHRYGIWLEPDRNNSIRTTTIQPIPERSR
jgi:hypothetical protein